MSYVNNFDDFSSAVSNAGMGLIGPIECQSIDEMRNVMDTNFFGLVRLLKEILPDMKRRKKGHIVVISSVMGIQGETGTSISQRTSCSQDCRKELLPVRNIEVTS